MIYTPDWFPGAGWKAIGRQYGVEKDRAKSGLYEWLKSQAVGFEVAEALILLYYFDANQSMSATGQWNASKFHCRIFTEGSPFVIWIKRRREGQTAERNRNHSVWRLVHASKD
jgi:hypothetical protein